MFAIILLCLALMNCSKSGPGTGTEGEPEPTPGAEGGESAGEAENTLEQAEIYLEQGSLSEARNIYTAIIENNQDAAAMQVKSDLPINTEAHFGRALCDMILLIERTPFTEMLASFGQPPWMHNTVFTEDGVLYQSIYNPPAAKENLPFNNIKGCLNEQFSWMSEWGRPFPLISKCLLSRIDSHYTLHDMAAQMLDLMPYVDIIIVDLQAAVEDSAASFTIPMELYSGEADITLNHADMVQILAGLNFLKAGVDLFNSWSLGLDLSTLVDENGNGLMTKREVVEVLNSIFDLRDTNRIELADVNFLHGLIYEISALEEILAGSSGGILNLSAENKPIYQDLLAAMKSLYHSFTSTQPVSGILPMININLNNFFTSPPDASEIELDAFVYEPHWEGSSSGRIKAVEAFWQQFINSVLVDYDLGEAGIKVFSADVRAISDPYTQLFKAIIGQRFGKFYLGERSE